MIGSDLRISQPPWWLSATENRPEVIGKDAGLLMVSKDIFQTVINWSVNLWSWREFKTILDGPVQTNLRKMLLHQVHKFVMGVG